MVGVGLIKKMRSVLVLWTGILLVLNLPFLSALGCWVTPELPGAMDLEWMAQNPGWERRLRGYSTYGYQFYIYGDSGHSDLVGEKFVGAVYVPGGPGECFQITRYHSVLTGLEPDTHYWIKEYVVERILYDEPYCPPKFTQLEFKYLNDYCDGMTGAGAPGPGPGCPMALPQNSSTGYSRDNNLLPQGLNSSVDVDDWYLLRETLNLDQGSYVLAIDEMQDYIDYIDHLELWAIDVDSGDNISISPSDGSAWSWDTPSTPRNATTEHGVNITRYVNGLDDELDYTPTSSEYVYLDFGDTPPNPASQGLIYTMIAPRWVKCGVPIEVYQQVRSGNWTVVDSGRPRTMLSTQASNLSMMDIGEGNIRILLPANITVDYLALTFSTVSVNHADVPVRAYLDFESNTTGFLPALNRSDNEYVELEVGETLTAIFTLPPVSGSSVRWFVIHIEGRYLEDGQERGIGSKKDSIAP